MKTRVIKIAAFFLVLTITTRVYAQSTMKTPVKSQTTKPKTVNTGSTTKTASVEVTVKVISKCEKSVMIFAGPKETLRDPKMKEFGGLSTNTVYVKTGNVVCLMDARKKPISCVSITKTTTQLEINSSGTAIVAK